MSLVLAIALCVTAACAAEDSGPRDEARLVALVNASRVERGLPALVRHDTLDRFARSNSVKMLKAGRIFHSEAVDLKALGMSAWAENVGTGPDVARLHERMLASPRHRENTLGPYSLVGVAVERTSDGQRYVTIVFATPR
jgi:uncharacterized protein YkwD